METSQILSQIKTPFTDKEIAKLIQYYLECNCEITKLYNKVNNTENKIKNPYLDELYNKLFGAYHTNNGFNNVINDKYRDDLGSWQLIASSSETLKIPYYPQKATPIYRIYINAKGKDKADILETYVKICEEKDQEYKLKYSKEDGRDDEIVILSSMDNLSLNIELIEEITKDIDLGNPPKLVGSYGKIGIGEEFIQAPIYSYTQTRLGMISIAMQKYILDHITEFNQYFNKSTKDLR